MQKTITAKQKVLNQIITLYQSIIEFSVENVGLEITIKHNKETADDMLDTINAHLIDVCDDYLKEHKLPLDKYQLSMIVMELYTKTISELPAPFRVTIKESKHLVQDYLGKNKSKREALERIKKENDALDIKIAQANNKKATKLVERDNEASWENFVQKYLKSEMPSGNSEAGAMGSIPPSIKPKKKRARTTDDLAVDNFYLPH